MTSRRQLIAVLLAACLVVAFTLVVLLRGPSTSADDAGQGLPQQLTVVFVGDSWTAGYGSSDPGTTDYVGRVAEARPGWRVRAVPGGEGTGYVNAGRTGDATYRRRVSAQPVEPSVDVVVVQGGLNDQTFVDTTSEQEAFDTAAARTLEGVRLRYPEARVVVVGAASPVEADGTPSLDVLDEHLRTAAEDAAMPYVSAYRWFGSDALIARYIRPDEHPNDDGYAYYADRLLTELDALAGTRGLRGLER